MSVPLVTVILPNYNHVQYLPQRLQSIFQQTYSNYEVILLDDASTDASMELINSYKAHSKVARIVCNEKNSGSPFRQWELGLSLAKGDYIWIAESDDWADETLLSKLMAVLLKDDTIQLAYCASYRAEQDGRLIGRHNWADGLDKKRWQESYINDGIEELKNYLQFRNTIPNASAVVFKKSAVSSTSFYTNFRYSGDWALWSSILKQGKIAYVAEPLNYFRRGSQSTTLSIQQLEKEALKIQEYIQNIKLAQRLSHQRTRFERRHLWIVNIWLNRYRAFKAQPAYYFPKLPMYLLFYFYALLAKKIWT